MQQDQQAKENLGSIMKPEFSGTDAQKVKQEIQKDVSEGQGAMTSREAGTMRIKNYSEWFFIFLLQN
ncbi:hypothetical protein FC682_17780 [Peribacillus simplex]|uniref:hypothetical protein n=1 Tax=Peribacillus simplex TaxID=1478 RepID=UPI0010BE285C|nr:hypothetical protein [Peribacillus simplex]TKH03485.1 hypothetical protein FC682_17780 [Peribacillus simplex]